MRAEAARNLLRDGDIARVDAVLATVEHGAEAAGGDADAVPAGLTVHLDLQTPPALPPRVELAAYRVPAEALRNVVRHARATTATISLRFVGGALELRITDDGVGLPDEPRPGVGRGSMRTRVTELGGALEIQTGERSGTTVRARLPLEVP